jgi:glutaminase
VRSIRARGLATVIRLQGGLGFTGAEDFLSTVAAHELTTTRVVVDMRRVNDTNSFGRAMVLEGLRRIREDGHRVAVIDPDGLLGDRRLDDGTQVETSEDPED